MGCTKAQLLTLLQYMIEECRNVETKQECVSVLEHIERKVRKSAWTEIVKELL